MPRDHSPRGRFTHYFGRRWDLGLCGQRSKRIGESEYTTCPKCIALMMKRRIPIKTWRPPAYVLSPDATPIPDDAGSPS